MSFCGLTIFLENKQQQQKFYRKTIELTFQIQKALLRQFNVAGVFHSHPETFGRPKQVLDPYPKILVNNSTSNQKTKT